MEACLLHNIIFINSLVSFYKENKTTEHLLNNDNTYDKVFIQNIHFKTKNTESTERRKTSFLKEKVENAYLHNPFKKIMTTLE